MYKVFFNERLIELYSITDEANLNNTLEISDNKDFKNKLSIILESEENLCLVGKSADFLLELFKTELKYIEAAGGIVTNEANELLFIHRLGVWDLPKGKLNKGESSKNAATREIAEECGIEGHELQNKINDTYHIYERKGKTFIKKTYWYHFLLNKSESQFLTPQIEEDIDQVVWFESDEIELALMDTYGTIIEVYQTFLELHM